MNKLKIYSKRKNLKSFTLIETIVSSIILVIVFGLILSTIKKLYSKNEIYELEAQNILVSQMQIIKKDKIFSNATDIIKEYTIVRTIEPYRNFKNLVVVHLNISNSVIKLNLNEIVNVESE